MESDIVLAEVTHLLKRQPVRVIVEHDGREYVGIVLHAHQIINKGDHVYIQKNTPYEAFIMGLELSPPSNGWYTTGEQRPMGPIPGFRGPVSTLTKEEEKRLTDRVTSAVLDAMIKAVKQDDARS